MKVLLDTVILIDYLNGHPLARAQVDAEDSLAISVITWIEVMAGVLPADEPVVKAFLSGMVVIPITPQIAALAASIRRDRQPRLKLPDAIILATAQASSYVLVTRNTRDFAEGQPGIHIPYAL